MTRRKGTSRVGESTGGSDEASFSPRQEFPSLRERRPVMFWTVIVAVLAMVLSTIASFISAFV